MGGTALSPIQPPAPLAVPVGTQPEARGEAASPLPQTLAAPQSPSPAMTSDVFFFFFFILKLPGIKKGNLKSQSITSAPSPPPNTALPRILTEALGGGSAPFRSQTSSPGWSLDPRPPGLGSQANPHPSRGPSLSPSTAFLGLPALCPASEATAKGAPALLCTPFSAVIANPDSFTIQMGVEDVGEAKALPDQREGKKASRILESQKPGRPLLPIQAFTLCLSWGVLKASSAQGPHPPNQTPIPAPSRAAAVSAGPG